MAPLFQPPPSTLATVVLALCFAIVILIVGLHLHRRYRHRPQNTLLSSPATPETQPVPDKKADERTPLLGEASTTHSVSAPRSSDLAFALTLPRPSAHLHDPSSSAAEQEAVEELPQPEPEDGGAISARGRVTVDVMPPANKAVRRTDIVARHPRFRRRVRTWDIGAVVPVQEPQEAATTPGSAQYVEDEGRVGIERKGTW